MVEVFILIFLIQKIKKVVEERGRNPKPFVWLTPALWVIFEISAIVYLIMGGTDIDLLWIPALLCGMAGGGVAYLIARNCKRGTYVRPKREVIEARGMERLPGAQLLPQPRTVKFVRESSVLGGLSGLKLSLNGQRAGKILDNDYLLINTPYTQNLAIINRQRFYFSIQPDLDGSMPEVYFKGFAFLPDKCVNCQSLDLKALELK